uniref:DPPIV_N domain-containing protein n=1 Tax=Macrostomum lignano TaxID=282301 RepID=A0A1I8F8E5_9PLAT
MRPVRITDNLGDPARVVWCRGLVVRREEVLQSDNALWIAPGNLYLAYLQFNDTSVPAYSMPLSRLPDITLWIYDIKGAAGVALKPPTGVPTESYVTRLAWLNESHLLGWTGVRTIGYLGVCTALSGGDCRLLSGQNQVGWISPAKYDVAELLRLELPSQPSQPGSFWSAVLFLSCRDDNSDSYDATKMHVHSISATENAPSANCITCPRAGPDSHQLLLNLRIQPGRTQQKQSTGCCKNAWDQKPYKYFGHYCLSLVLVTLHVTLLSLCCPVPFRFAASSPADAQPQAGHPAVFHSGVGSTNLASSLFVISVSVDARGAPESGGSKFLFDIRRLQAICLGRTGKTSIDSPLGQLAQPAASTSTSPDHSGHRLGHGSRAPSACKCFASP